MAVVAVTVCMGVYMWAPICHACVMTYVCRSEDNSVKSVVFFHLYLSPGLAGFLGKHLYPLSRLAGHLALAGLNSQSSWCWDDTHGPLSIIRMAFSIQSHLHE